MDIDWITVGSIATTIIALAAVIALISEVRLNRLTIGSDLLWKLEERFFADPAMLANRRQAAKAILEIRRDSKEGNEVRKNPVELGTVLNTFEMVGLYLRRGVIDKELVWNHFCYWSVNYYCACEKLIAAEVEKDDTWRENHRDLANRMLKFDAKRRKKSESEVRPTEDEIDSFLIEESIVS